MREEHLKVWLREKTREKYPEPRWWYKLVSATKLAFREGRILTALTWMMMVLISKVGGEYRYI